MRADDPAPADSDPSEGPARPRHIAVVMDGNGRWASRRGLPRSAGHRAGAEAARSLVTAAMARGIPHMTFFAFSSENWNRPSNEVGLLMDLMLEALQREMAAMDREGAVIRFIGDRSSLADRLLDRMREAEDATRDNDGIHLNVAIAYGGRWDIARAARVLAERVAAGELGPDAVDEDLLADALSLADEPEPDLFIRTGGEHRISNFLLWDLAYTELYFDETLWPDFDAASLDRALDWFAARQRRFGRTPEQVERGRA